MVDLKKIKKEFLKYNISLKDEWLKSIKLNNRSNDVAENFLSTFNHFINDDIQSSSHPFISENLVNSTSTKIENLHILQIVSVRDIGNPLHGDHEKRSSQCLSLNLTDGQQFLTAFEFKSCFDPKDGEKKINVGAKMAVKNIICRRGVLFMRPKNYFLLGGDITKTKNGIDSRISLDFDDVEDLFDFCK